MNIEAVGDDVLLVIDTTQILMPRDMAAQIGLGLIQVSSAPGSVLDDSVGDATPGLRGDPEPDREHGHGR